MKPINAVLLPITLTAVIVFSPGCATPYLKGRDVSGEKVYISKTPIQETEIFRKFLKTAQTEPDKLNYLNELLKSAKDCVFYRDGTRHNWLEAYRGGTWILRKNYQKGQTARDFIRKNIWRSPKTQKPYLVEFPDGQVHIGYYILLNELDRLEEAAGRS